MSQLLTPANLEDVVKPIPVKRSSDFSKTQKNSTKINMLLKTLQEMDDEDASNLSVFNPPPKPVSIGSTKTNPLDTSVETPPARASSSNGPGLELNNLKFNYPEPSDVETYYQKYLNPMTTKQEGYTNRPAAVVVPSTTASTQGASITPYPTHTDKTLTDKINYMIHLLEDKQDVKSNSRVEEIGLYCLLGIFTIFLVDSFSRVGKYVR
jgi:hypothetical protein